jgi:hypothetical protein
MTADYLPKHASDIEACDWLKVQTGENWTLARLLENGLMPWFWLDYKPDYPAIFGDHIEGYLAPMVFTGDTQRLEADGSHALVNLTHTHDGVVMKVEPSITVSIKELKFKREDLQALSSTLKKPAPKLPNANATATIKTPASVKANGASTRIHSTKARRDILSPVIELAQTKCRNPQDVAEVWGVMQGLAEKKTAPLIGATEEGVQYLKGGEAVIFKRDSLAKRLNR